MKAGEIPTPREYDFKVSRSWLNNFANNSITAQWERPGLFSIQLLWSNVILAVATGRKQYFKEKCISFSFKIELFNLNLVESEHWNYTHR